MTATIDRPATAPAAPPRRRTARRAGRVALCLWLVAIGVFVLAPLVTIMGASFGDQPFFRFPPSGWTLDPYRRLFGDAEAVQSLWVSFASAVLAGLTGCVLGLLVALAIVRSRRGVNHGLAAAMLLPLMIPHIALGAALYVVYIRLGIPFSTVTLAFAQLVLVLPFSVRSLMGAIQGLDTGVERAAMSLGARPYQVGWRVTLPALRSGLAVAFVLGFSTSFDDAAIALFINSPTSTNMPVRLLGYLEGEVGPFIAAGGSVLLCAGFLIVTVIGRLIGIGRAFGIKERDGR
ncbi:ABC transporter permease [Actinomadura sp. NBRC 104412]|uniref:ABC transporter permease n=1 Tax=Actinomadura sp. NBRC 104412 TaxID=3032203 RepID=UPI0024A020A9|nr:ABC transporter permease [Actinomadura sp. NBRC 104412]GLZ07514.1 ABC transporter permease [Actinomadura sp. NBRC 104412]